MYLLLIVFYLLIILAYLAFDNFSLNSINSVEKIISKEPTNNHTIIEFLTQYIQRVEKDYNIPPKGLSTSRYNVTGSIINDTHAAMSYQFPLVKGKVSNIKIDLKPQSVSALVDSFGLSSPYVSEIEGGINYAIPKADTDEFNQFQRELSAGNWIIEDGELNVDYKNLVRIHQSFCSEISNHIVKELKDFKSDTYFNRVQAVLNFVQHIPYGQPLFNKNNFNFFGLALPPESFILNYSDCDSKSIFFASILSNLISHDNIVLVRCITAEPHMMVAVKGLNIFTGQHVECDGDDFLLLETTTPCVIGEKHWENFRLKKIIKLAN